MVFSLPPQSSLLSHSPLQPQHCWAEVLEGNGVESVLKHQDFISAIMCRHLWSGSDSSKSIMSINTDVWKHAYLFCMQCTTHCLVMVTNIATFSGRMFWTRIPSGVCIAFVRQRNQLLHSGTASIHLLTLWPQRHWSVPKKGCSVLPVCCVLLLHFSWFCLHSVLSSRWVTKRSFRLPTWLPLQLAASPRALHFLDLSAHHLLSFFPRIATDPANTWRCTSPGSGVSPKDIQHTTTVTASTSFTLLWIVALHNLY